MTETLYGYFKDGQLVDGPRELPKSFITTDNKTILGFNKLEISNPEKLKELNWYVINDPVVEYDNRFQSVSYSSWYLTEDDILTRDHFVFYVNYDIALYTAFSILDSNRELYEISGFVYNYNGIDVRILTDKGSSQVKLTISEIKAKDGTRKNTDVFKFVKVSDGNTIVVQLTNSELLNITSFIYRKIQDSYNLTSEICWQMLSYPTTEELVENINNGNINLNPWSVPTDDTPWQY